MKFSCFVLFLTFINAFLEAAIPPNIVFILADDLGWNDVSFHGSDQILTPNIDALAYNGLILHQHYSENLCSPSRAALLTGKYPIHTGMQHNVILEPEPRGLPLTEEILPQHLQRLGYETHAVGKWHLGFFKKDYTPHHRGFKTHFGFWNGYQDYYKHTVQASFFNFEGYDMRWNDNVTWEGLNRYSTDVFTDQAVEIIATHDASKPLFLYLAHLAPHAGNYDDPLQAPREVLDELNYITDKSRRAFAGMVRKLDESVGKVVEALEKSQLLNNTIIVFISDNGAATNGLHSNKGSNWPLKGEKSTPWEGGVRTVGCLWSSFLTDKSRVSKQIVHITDWLPTLYFAAGGKIKDLGAIDGVNQYESLFQKKHSARHEMLHNIDDITGYAAIRVGDLKYIRGSSFYGFLDNWTGKIYESKSIPIPKYNTTAILNSKVSKSLERIGEYPPSEDGIQILRQQSTIVCDNSKKTAAKSYPNCNPFRKPCIFNILKDPCETKNLYLELQHNGVLQDIENRLTKIRKTVTPPNNKRTDVRASPKFYNNTWVCWGDINNQNITVSQSIRIRLF